MHSSKFSDFVMLGLRLEVLGRIGLWFVASWFGSLLLPDMAKAQPALTSVSPSAVAPGKTTEVTLSGTKLDDPLHVWTSFKGQVEVLPLKDAKAKTVAQRTLKITVAADETARIGGIVVANKEGASDPILVLMDDLPTVADSGKNGSPAQAQELKLPIAVDGVSDGSQFDYFKFAAKAGQRLSFEVVAGRLAQNFDPVVRILDSSGKQLLIADDDLLSGSDSRFEHKFAADGDFVLEVRDNQYRTGGRYRLRVGDFALSAVSYPLPKESAAGNSGPETLESEPNNELAKANLFAVPGSANGRFDSPKDRDYFQFDAKKGERLAFRAVTRSAGSPANIRMFVQKPDGAALAESAVTDADEETLVFAIPADGRYVLRVEELLQRSGPEFVYRVAVDRAAAFTLALKADKKGKLKYSMPKNGALAIDVPCVRAGYDGPITLSVESPAGPFLVFNNVIPEKGVTAKLIIVAPPEMPDGIFAPLRIIGRATIDGQEVTSTLATGDLLRTLSPTSYNMPSWVEGRLNVGVIPAAKTFFATSIDKPSLTITGNATSAEFNVALERTNADFKDPISIYFADAPPGFTFDVKREGNGPKENYKVTMKLPAKLPTGNQKIRVVSYGELKTAPQVALAELPIQFSSPLTVAIAPAGGLVFGNQQKVKITVVRSPGADGKTIDRQPVTLKWKKLPAGVTSAESVTIAADKDSVEVELTADAKAAAGKLDDLVVIATTKSQGQDVTVESSPLGAEVRK